MFHGSGWTYEMRQVFLEDLRLGPGPVTAAHQRRLDKMWVAAAAVAKAKAQAKAQAETKQAAFQATEEARMRGVRTARAKTDTARRRPTAFIRRAEDVGSRQESGRRTKTEARRRGMENGGRMTETGDRIEFAILLEKCSEVVRPAQGVLVARPQS